MPDQTSSRVLSELRPQFRAAIVGSFVLLALDRMGIDPAAATGVFITTSNDVVGVLVHFLMACTFYFRESA